MSFGKAIILAGTAIGFCLSGIYLTSCSKGGIEGMIIFTRAPADYHESDKESVIHHYPGSQIVAIDPDKPEQSEIILTAGFYSACSPEISYDAEKMLFAAQQNEDDTWQVWEMDFGKGTSKKITGFEESCTGPAYLPGGRLVFTRQIPDAVTESGYALYTMNLDGSNLSRITFQPHSDYPAGILRDGRILMLTRQLYPDIGSWMYMAIRPNGTKAELFHKGTGKSILNTRAYETMDGYVYFIRWEEGNEYKGDLVSVNQNRPLFTLVNHTSEITGSFYSAFPLPSGDMFVSYRPVNKPAAGLYRFSVNERSLGESIVEYPDYHIVEPVLVEAYTRPRNLPDEVDKMQSTGQLLCQDINVTSMPLDTTVSYTTRATRLEILGIDKSLGIVPVEEDGSFYLKVIADTPFRIQTLDDNGRVLNGPSGWLWLRPFERRGCVGCHADPELVPENFVPLAVKKQPVSIPVEGTQEPELSPAVEITE
ncbi:MAG: hypothetical protein JSV24_10305 [Bacteroidales bacterium]|nr:MAG: hypothetical protein JSV24_10305 [Bacteroidales bacterium]